MIFFYNKKLLMATVTQPLAFNVYNSVAQQVEQAKLKVQKQTPVVSVLQPVQVPVVDETSGMMVLVGFTTIFIFGVIGYILISYLLIHKIHYGLVNN